MDELKAPGKPFDISKQEVWEAYRQVRANQGAPGVDGCSIEDFEKDLKGNLNCPGIDGGLDGWGYATSLDCWCSR